MTESLLESVFRVRAVRWMAAAAFLCRAAVHAQFGHLYRATSDYCWVERVSKVGPLRAIARRAIFDLVAAVKHDGNVLADAYRADPESMVTSAIYALSGPGDKDLFRDVMVLKSAASGEKGVILLKYARTFDALQAMFDVPKLMERYIFVLEPCWAGYCDPSLLMFVVPGQPVFVQCFTEEDFRFVESVGAPLVPLRLGPADWVDADMFQPRTDGSKQYDVVMVANWARHKRHEQLFRALQEVGDRDLRVLLIGFPWAGRTAADIRLEAAAIGNPRVTVDIIEKLPANEVAKHVSLCKVFVFLSRKEGDNKALVEAMFADVPAVVFKHTVGGASSRINPSTGILADDHELARAILHVLDHGDDFAPRAWALEHTGSARATAVLDEAIRRTITASGGRYTEGIVEKTNAPNLAYKDPRARAGLASDYEAILSCRRDHVVRARNAVA